MLRQQPLIIVQPLAWSYPRFILHLLALAASIVIVYLSITALIWLVIVPNFFAFNGKDTFSCTFQTDLWRLKFSTQLSEEEISNLSPIDLDVLGLSIDRAMALNSHSTVVFRADFIIDTNQSKRISNTKKLLRKSRLEIDLKFQYPELCCGIKDCEDVFEYRIKSKWRKERGQKLIFRSVNGLNQEFVTHLYELIVRDRDELCDSTSFQTKDVKNIHCRHSSNELKNK